MRSRVQFPSVAPGGVTILFMKFKGIAFFSTVLLLLSTATAAALFAAPVHFVDIPAGAWYEEAVLKLSSMGVFSDTPNHHFEPTTKITRAELAARLDRVVTHLEQPFGDQWELWQNDYYSILVPSGMDYNSDAWTDNCSSGLIVNGEYVWTVECKDENYDSNAFLASYSDIQYFTFEEDSGHQFRRYEQGVSAGGIWHLQGVNPDGTLFQSKVYWDELGDPILIKGVNSLAFTPEFEAFMRSFLRVQ